MGVVCSEQGRLCEGTALVKNEDPTACCRPPTLAVPVRDKVAMAVAGPSDPVVTIIAALRTGMITATAGDESGVRLACR